MIVVFSPGCHLHRWRVIREAYYSLNAKVLHYSYRNRTTWMAAQHCACLMFWSLVRSAVSNYVFLVIYGAHWLSDYGFAHGQSWRTVPLGA